MNQESDMTLTFTDMPSDVNQMIPLTKDKYLAVGKIHQGKQKYAVMNCPFKTSGTTCSELSKGSWSASDKTFHSHFVFGNMLVIGFQSSKQTNFSFEGINVQNG